MPSSRSKFPFGKVHYKHAGASAGTGSYYEKPPFYGQPTCGFVMTAASNDDARRALARIAAGLEALGVCQRIVDEGDQHSPGCSQIVKPGGPCDCVLSMALEAVSAAQIEDEG